MKNRTKKIAEIARDRFGIKTLESQGSDSLDFHEVSVWSVKNALLEAYEAGKREGLGRDLCETE